MKYFNGALKELKNLKKNGIEPSFYYIIFIMLSKLINCFKQIASILLLKIEKLQESKTDIHLCLKKNEVFRNLYIGGKIFILASGSSLQSLEEACYKNSIIIAVNEVYTFLQKKSICPHYLLINDDAYFNEKKHETFLFSVINASVTSKMQLMIPLRHKEKVMLIATEQRHLENIFYYDTYSSPGLDAFYSYNHDMSNFDFSLPLPSLPTVTHVALCFAMFLGASTIYLAGVDMDYVMKPLEPIKHCYDNLINVEMKKSCMEEYQTNAGWNYKDLLHHTLKQIECYEIIYKIALKYKINIFNLSVNTAIEVFPLCQIRTVIQPRSFV